MTMTIMKMAKWMSKMTKKETDTKTPASVHMSATIGARGSQLVMRTDDFRRLGVFALWYVGV